LPINVKVLSLGKESGKSRLKYLFKFFCYIIRFRNDYDAVLSHMNQEYVILGSAFWKILSKKVYMWRNHYAGSFLTDVASLFCDKIFCTSKFSYIYKYRKTVLMPVGIDTEKFKPDQTVNRAPGTILSIGRISPSKKIEQFIEVLSIVRNNGLAFTASVYGDALVEDEDYHNLLKEKVKMLGLDDRVKFYSGVPNDKTPEIYRRHRIFVNLSKSGMFDKTIFEAMACGTVAISCSKDLVGKIESKYSFKEDDLSDLATKITQALQSPSEELKEDGLKHRGVAIENHSLAKLAVSLKAEISSNRQGKI
jgi:glycosyltransferase involved in cell wall biosynthesis